MNPADILRALQEDKSEEIENVPANYVFPDEIPGMKNVPELIENCPPILSMAAFYAAEKCTDMLVQKGAKFCKDECELDTINYAVNSKNISYIQKLIHIGAPIPDKIGFYALRFELFDLVDWLLENNYIHTTDTDYTKASYLHVASQKGNTELVKKLLSEKTIDVNSADYEGRTPLHFASGEGHMDIVRLLLNTPGIDVNKLDRFDKPAIYYAISQEHFDIAELLLGGDLNKTLDNGQTQLMVASRKGNSQLVALLSSIPQVDVNLRNSYGLAALHFASRFGCEDTVSTMLNTGRYNLDIVDNFGKTPMHYAAEANNVNIINDLIKHGAKVNIKDNDGKCAIDYLDDTLKPTH